VVLDNDARLAINIYCIPSSNITYRNANTSEKTASMLGRDTGSATASWQGEIKGSSSHPPTSHTLAVEVVASDVVSAWRSPDIICSDNA
jgi:hypothetical protein